MTDPVPAERNLLGDLRNGTWLDKQEFPPLKFVVPGLIPEGMTLLVGPPKAGKSWAALDIGLAVASGGCALGAVKVGAPRPVLLLALEDGHRRLQDRCRALLGPEPIPQLWHYLVRLAEPGAVVETIRRWLDRNGDLAPLIILDTLGKVMPPSVPGESAYGRDYRVGSTLKRAVDDYPGSGLLVLHHDRKAGADDFVDSVSGTHGLAGAADTVAVLVRARQESAGSLHITGRDVPEGEYAIDLDAGASWRISGGDLAHAAAEAVTRRATAGLGDASAEIVAFVAKHPKGVRAADVAEFVDIDRDKARVYLTRLADSGRIGKVARGLYTPVTSVSSVTESENEPPQRNTNNRSNTGTGELITLDRIGPCAGCGADTHRYGPGGNPLCATCTQKRVDQ